MKPLVFLNGPMGVGKSTVATLLQQKFDRCAYLDGDWCYRVHPFRVTNESKALVLSNIAYLLDGYLKSPDVDLVLFSWVMNKREIRDAVLSKMTERGKCLFVTLTASEEALVKRFAKDIAAGLHAGGLTSGAFLSARLQSRFRRPQTDHGRKDARRARRDHQRVYFDISGGLK